MDNVEYVIWMPFGDMMHTGDVNRSQAIYNKCLCNPEWWEHRAQIMRDYTLPSLQAQTFKQFKIFAGIRSETVSIAKPVIRALLTSGLSVAIMHCDEQAALMSLGKVSDKAWIVKIHLDSDDMYSAGAMEIFANIQPKHGMVGLFRNGYIYDVNSGRMAEYNTAAPPFFCKCYHRGALRNEAQLKAYETEWLKPYHHQLPDCQRVVRLPHWNYCVTIHGKNTSTAWTNAHTADKIGADVKAEAILPRFGVKALQAV